MRKLWLAVKHDYSKNIRQKSFLIAIFSLPLFLGLSFMLGYFMQSQTRNSETIGFVDRSGVFENPISLNEISDKERVEIVSVLNTEEAERLLKNGSLQAYFLIPDNYPSNIDIEMFYFDQPGENALNDFYDFLQLNLARNFPEEIRKRVSIGTNSIIRSPDGSREFPENNPSVSMFLPLFIGLGFIMLLLISSGYLMSGFLDERSNRTIELLITSLSPTQLVGSKLITMVAIGLTMLATWIIVSLVAIVIGVNILDLEWVKEITINWDNVFVILSAALPSYIFAAALMLGIGLLLGNSQEAESIGPLFFMVSFVPIWFVGLITNNLDGTAALILSSLPITSILTIGLRSIFIEIPTWQLVLSLSVQFLMVFGAIWLAVSTLRIGLLRTGSKIRLRELFPNQHLDISEENK
jgi:ABC-2 type transport system permease protein